MRSFCIALLAALVFALGWLFLLADGMKPIGARPIAEEVCFVLVSVLATAAFGEGLQSIHQKEGRRALAVCGIAIGGLLVIPAVLLSIAMFADIMR